MQTAYPLECYLQETSVVDFGHPLIQKYIAAYQPQGRGEIEIASDTFEFVRDQVHHSWDIQSKRITVKGSDALQYREGICYAKSHLLAALLRGMEIPSGFCYQRLTLGDIPETGFAIHAFNTVYLTTLTKWIRLDARGNKPGINAQFSIIEEHLAFPIREELGERDYRINHCEPHPKIIQALTAHTDCRVMYAHGLPTELS